MRQINKIVVHCSATPPDMDIGVSEIDVWHRAPPNNWDSIGYHYVIRRDGTVETGRPDYKVGAHAAGHNQDSIGVCLIGGVNEDNKPDANYTMVQYGSLFALLKSLASRFEGAEILGHRDLPGVRKACPSFDAKEFIKHAELVYG